MQPRLNLAECIPAFGRVRWCGLNRGPYDRSEGKLDPQTLGVPAHNECRNDGLIPTGRGSEEIDGRDLLLHRVPEPAIIRGVRVGAHELVVDYIIARINLAVSFTLIVVPNPSASPGEHGSDG